MRALVTGGTGFIGRRLLRALEAPVLSSRRGGVGWPPPPGSLRGVDVVFNLAGENVGDGRWTKKKKARIRESRVDGTRALVESIAGAPVRPRVLVSASAVGYYGDRGDEILDEGSTRGGSFLAEVCGAWEAEALRARDLGLRVAVLRFGLVLGPDGGVLPRLAKPFRWCVGGRLGHGRQWMSWIHVEDLVPLLLRAAESLDGIFNAVAPDPVTNREFTRTLASVLGRPAIFPVPRWVLRAAVGEFAREIVSSQRVRSRVPFEFRHPSLEGALRASL